MAIRIMPHVRLTILNGRVTGDSFGQITSHQKNGISVVDCIIIEQDLFPLVQSFVVRVPNYLCDHSQLNCCVVKF